jgi:hypothetical protein
MTFTLLSPAAFSITVNSVFSSFGAAAAAPPPPDRDRHGGRRGDAELLFHVLDELRELEDGHLADLFQNLCSFHCALFL